MNTETLAKADYAYTDAPRNDVLRMIPEDGRIVGSVGCGYGATEEQLTRAGRTVYGVDIAPEVAAVAAKRMARFDLIKPGDSLPWEPGSLDGLVLADVIEHVPCAADVLAEWVRCVRVGGWVVISVPNMRSVDVVVEFLWKGDWPERPSGIFDRTHLQVMSHKRLFRWCEQAGLAVERVFDKYDPNGPRRNKFFRRLDTVTLHLFHSWMMYQIQCRCRRR